MINEILLRRKNKIIIQQGNSDSPNASHIATILKNLEGLGYTVSKDVFQSLTTFTTYELENFYLETIQLLKRMLGANVRHNVMYPNFPQQVMNMNECELYINAIVHYWSLGNLFPKYDEVERLPLFEATSLTTIDIGTMDEFDTIFSNLLKSNTSISEVDKQDIEWYFKNNDEGKVKSVLPSDIPLKENVALAAKLLLQYTNLNYDVLLPYFKTATDVLRLAVALSDGDISLAENTRFKSFKRKERRMLLALLNNCNSIEEDMVRHKNVWIRLGERLHPLEYKIRYLKAQQAFTKLRNNEKILTFNGRIDMAIKDKNYDTLIQLLKSRTGEFARRLDYVLRLHPNSNIVINEFKDIVHDVSTTVLLQVKEHFKHRNIEHSMRVFFPKGNVSKAYGIENNLPGIDNRICETIVKLCENSLIDIYKSKEFLGKVYIDTQLKDHLVPFSQRSSSKSLKSLVRGSKIDFPQNMNTIRSFIYWKESITGRADIDLSAVMYDTDWNYIEHISYTNLRSSKYQACHSGDITSAPNGASEFIDLDINSIRQYGGRYVVLSINSFTEQPFAELPECFMGWMPRENPNSGEIYEAKTVQEKVDITSNTKVCIPLILDLDANKIIWTDIALGSNPYYYNNVEGNEKGMVLMGKAMTQLIKPNLYDLFELHVKARGERCDNVEEADLIFSLDKGITPFDQDIIVSDYL